MTRKSSHIAAPHVRIGTVVQRTIVASAALGLVFFAPTILGQVRPATTAPASSADSLPAVTYPDFVLLTETLRGAFRDKLKDMPEKGPGYRPPALRDIRAIIHVVVRSNGVALAEVESGEMDVMDAAVAAGVLAARTVLGKPELRARSDVQAGGDELGLEIEWIGPPEYLVAKFREGSRWSDELLHSFEGGIEGIGVELGGKRGRTRPGAIIALNYTPDLALLAAEDAARVSTLDKARRPDEIRYFRFRTYLLWQRQASARPIPLTRGSAPIELADVTAEGLDSAIMLLGSYMRYRQYADGWFSHEFAPSRDRFLPQGGSSAQLVAVQALAEYAAQSRDPSACTAALRSLRRVAGYLLEARPADEASSKPATSQPAAASTTQPRRSDNHVAPRLVLHFSGDVDHLELSARLLSALDAIKDLKLHAPIATSQTAECEAGASEFVPERRGLAETLMAAQKDDGRLKLSIESDETQKPENLFGAAVGLKALAGYGERDRRSDVERLLSRSLPYYQSKLVIPKEGVQAREAGPKAASELIRSYSAAYDLTNDARYSDLVFELADQFAVLQVTRDNCPWPDLYGAINTQERGAVGADSASYVAALADALRLANRVGDRDRIARYRSAVEWGCRFILQLQFHESGCFYVRSPRDVLGGIRAAPWDNQIRIDDCSVSLIALMAARNSLFGEISQ